MTFEDGELEGLWVRAKGFSVSEFLDTNTFTEQLDLFGLRLVDWNWEYDDGTPIPPVRESFDELDQSDIRTVVGHWWETCAKAHPDPFSKPLRQRPVVSEVEVSIPMDPPST
jgi:hypothetical protein